MKNFIARISGTKDLTEGKPSKLILNFGLPLLFGLIFQQFYNMVDSVIVGQKLGTDALAAVGSTGSINFMILGFCIGICNGFAIPVAQAYGAKDFKALKAYIINSIWSSVALAAVITVAVSIFTMQILKALRTPSNIIDDAYIYIFIIFLGIPATFLYNLTAGILRSLGDSITPVIFLVGSSIVNIILDLILVVPMGVAGAAVATVASQAVSGIICTIYMTKKLKYLEFSKEDWTFSMRHCLKLCGMGLPMGLQYSITAVSFFRPQSMIWVQHMLQPYQQEARFPCSCAVLSMQWAPPWQHTEVRMLVPDVLTVLIRDLKPVSRWESYMPSWLWLSPSYSESSLHFSL